MKKVFFGDRSVTLTKDIEGLPAFDAMHKYSNINELRQFVDKFQTSENLKTACIYYYDEARLWEMFSKLFKSITAAGGLIENSNGKYLVIERLGKIDLPKGKAEEDETPAQTALREVGEETGLTEMLLSDEICQTYHTYELRGEKILKTTHWFKMCEVGEPDLTPQTEENITSAKWLTKEEILEARKNTYPSLASVFDFIK